MLTETELIVLGGVKYSDNASIVTTYSERMGTLAFKSTRSASRRRGRASALFHPLTIANVTFDYFPKRSIQIPLEQELIHRPLRPSIDPHANAVSLFTIELLTRLLRSTGADAILYHYIRQEIIGLETLSEKGVSSFHLRLIVGLLLHLGILPITERYRLGDVLDIEEGTFRPFAHYDDPTLPFSSSLLHQFIISPEPQEIPLTREGRNALLQLLLSYLNHHLPDVGNLKSTDILTQLF